MTCRFDRTSCHQGDRNKQKQQSGLCQPGYWLSGSCRFHVHCFHSLSLLTYMYLLTYTYLYYPAKDCVLYILSTVFGLVKSAGYIERITKRVINSVDVCI